MSVEVELSSVFGRYTGGHLNTRVKGKTVRECLHDLVRQFPKLKRMLLDGEGNLMHAYDYFINGESVYPKDMNAPLQSPSQIISKFLSSRFQVGKRGNHASPAPELYSADRYIYYPI
jgi:hypothetical protein